MTYGSACSSTDRSAGSTSSRFHVSGSCWSSRSEATTRTVTASIPVGPTEAIHLRAREPPTPSMDGTRRLHPPHSESRRDCVRRLDDLGGAVMRIYVASSWRHGTLHRGAVWVLRRSGHEVYDFREPAPGNTGFSWSEIDEDWQDWTVKQYRDALNHPVAEAGFKFDHDALDWADCGVLVMPCGRSAHLELGYLAGQGKPCAVLAPEPMEPELMVKLCSGGVLDSFEEMIRWARTLDRDKPRSR